MQLVPHRSSHYSCWGASRCLPAVDVPWPFLSHVRRRWKHSFGAVIHGAYKEIERGCHLPILEHLSSEIVIWIWANLWLIMAWNVDLVSSKFEVSPKICAEYPLLFFYQKVIKTWYHLVNVYKKLMGKIHHAINGKIHELNHHFQ